MCCPSDRGDGLAVVREGTARRTGMEAAPALVGVGGAAPALWAGWAKNWASCKGGYGKDSKWCVTADSVPWPSAEARASPAERQHWCPPLQTTPPRHTAQCPRTRTLSWCFFAAMSMTSAMAASSRTLSSLLRPTLRLPTGKWGLGQGVLLEAQHLVKGPQGPEVDGLWFSWGEGGGRQGPLWVLGPWEGRGGQGIEKASQPSAWPRAPLYGCLGGDLKKQSSLRLGQA